MENISREELEELYNNNTNEYVCNKLGISHVTLIKFIQDSGIKKKEKGGGFTKKYTVLK